MVLLTPQLLPVASPPSDESGLQTTQQTHMSLLSVLIIYSYTRLLTGSLILNIVNISKMMTSLSVQQH